MISTMQAKFKKALFTAGSIAFWILLWHIGATLANKELLFKIPLPLDTLREFFTCVKTLEFWDSVGTSLWHIVTGFVFAVILGLFCGLLSGSSTFFATLTAPLTRLIRAVPVAAFIILAWLWIPSEIIPAFIAFLMVFPIVWSHVETGLLSVDKRLVEMARVMGMDKKGIIKNITIPSVMPQFRVSCITGLGYAWKSGVAAEVLCNPTGSIGAMLSQAKSNLDYSRVFAIVLMVVLLSFILENIIKFFWKERSA